MSLGVEGNLFLIRFVYVRLLPFHVPLHVVNRIRRFPIQVDMVILSEEW